MRSPTLSTFLVILASVLSLLQRCESAPPFPQSTSKLLVPGHAGSTPAIATLQVSTTAKSLSPTANNVTGNSSRSTLPSAQTTVSISSSSQTSKASGYSSGTTSIAHLQGSSSTQRPATTARNVNWNATGSVQTSSASQTATPPGKSSGTLGTGSPSSTVAASLQPKSTAAAASTSSQTASYAASQPAASSGFPFLTKPPLPPVANGNQNPAGGGNLPAWATLLAQNIPLLEGQGAALIAQALNMSAASLVSTGVELLQFIERIGQYAYMLQTELSPTCVQDLNSFQQSLGKMEVWALKMLDALGKIKPGILKGQKVVVGDYDECMEISKEITGDSLIDGHFCKLDVKTNFTGLGGSASAIATLLPVITVHVCVPDSCSATDLYNLFYGVVETVGGQSAELVATKCMDSKDPTDDGSFWAAIAVLTFLVLMCGLGTAYGLLVDRRTAKYQEEKSRTPEATTIATTAKNGHVNAGFDDVTNKSGTPAVELKAVITSDNWTLKSPMSNGDSQPTPVPATGEGMTSFVTSSNGNVASETSPKKDVKKRQEGLCSKLLLSFSVLKNGSKILNCEQGQGDLGCLHGIRVLSITWVLLGHCFSMFGETQGNQADFMILIPRWTTAPLISGTLSVDSFFLLSGALTSYVFLRQTKRDGGISCKAMILYYVHRFWRLTPLYMVAIMFYACVLPYMVVGPFADERVDATNCKKYWWHNLLYVNNILDYEHQCMGWSWYLANDMQFYVLAPIVLIPWAFGKKTVGIVISCLLLLTHLICVGIINYKVEGMLFLRNMDDYMPDVYYPPWCRIGPFAVGLVVGYVLLETKCQYKMEKLSVFLGWLLATAVGLTVVYVTHDDVRTLYPNMEPAWNNWQASVYEAMSRPAWACAVGWVIFACCSGYGGFVNTLLSWSAWSPLSRLTYGTYLFHLIIFDFFVDNRTDTFYLNPYNGTEMFLCVTVLSFLVSFIFSVLVESPTLGVEKALLGGASAPRKKRQ